MRNECSTVGVCTVVHALLPTVVEMCREGQTNASWMAMPQTKVKILDALVDPEVEPLT